MRYTKAGELSSAAAQDKIGRGAGRDLKVLLAGRQAGQLRAKPV